MLNPNTNIASATITAAAAQAGVAISALPSIANSEYTLCVQVTNLTAASGTPAAVIAIEDSVDGFTNKITRAFFEFYGTISVAAGNAVTLKKRVTSETPGLRIGTASAVVRSNVQELLGTTPSLTFIAWLE